MGKGIGQYVFKDNKKLALGYTTGSCAAAASKAAAVICFTKEDISNIKLMTPKGILLNLDVLEISHLSENEIKCAIKKDAGDDPDVTDGILVYSGFKIVSKEGSSLKINLDGGVGVGRVTKPGLEQAVGEAAINKVPREMIKEAVREICEENDFLGEVNITIEIPEGVEISKRTFNPRLGIEGGISVLGTSGIVEPMSEEALIASIKLEMRQKVNRGSKYLVITPGNYGKSFLSTNIPVLSEDALKCSNFVGETLDYALELGVKGILFVSHIGKFVKVAGGIMNTHSKNADSRMEIMAANALRAGADNETLKEIMSCLTTDEAVNVLKKHDILDNTINNILEKILFYLNNRTYGNIDFGVILFSNEHGELGKAGKVDEICRELCTE